MPATDAPSERSEANSPNAPNAPPAQTRAALWPGWLAGALLLVFAGVAWRFVLPAPLGQVEAPQQRLDPAQVIVLRTPGGQLEVSTLVKVEEFGWRSSRTCLWRDCGWLLGERLGSIRVPVHYSYRIPLAEDWTLRPAGDGYVLSVPAPQAMLPPAIDLAKAEFRSEKGGLLAPDSGANQAKLLQHLGPELARRAERIEYLQLQAPQAEKTIREFAQKWMREQFKEGPAPLRIEVRMGAGG